MQTLLKIVIMTAAWLLTANVAAVTVVECIDADGNSSFRDKCPPGTVKKGEKRLRGVGGRDEPSMQDIAAANPITLYSVPDCDACDLVRNVFTGRDIPFREVDVQDNAELQEQMKAATGGLTVPAMLVGGRVITGYSRDAIDSALEQAGYPIIADKTVAAE